MFAQVLRLLVNVWFLTLFSYFVLRFCYYLFLVYTKDKRYLKIKFIDIAESLKHEYLTQALLAEKRLSNHFETLFHLIECISYALKENVTNVFGQQAAVLFDRLSCTKCHKKSAQL